MKLTITKEEIDLLFVHYYNLPTTTTIELDLPAPAPVPSVPPVLPLSINDIISAMRKEGLLDAAGGINPNKKIAAIKLLRTLIHTATLFDAKQAIDNWTEFVHTCNWFGMPTLNVNR